MVCRLVTQKPRFLRPGGQGLEGGNSPHLSRQWGFSTGIQEPGPEPNRKETTYSVVPACYGLPLEKGWLSKGITEFGE